MIKRVVRDNTFIIIPTCIIYFIIFLLCIADGKYHAMHTGELLVHNLESSDQFSSYTCQMMHTLTRKVTTSSPANIVVHGKIKWWGRRRWCKLSIYTTVGQTSLIGSKGVRKKKLGPDGKHAHRRRWRDVNYVHSNYY